MKLELGSGDRPSPGYIHLDCRPDAPELDICADAANLSNQGTCEDPVLEPGSCSEIRAAHLLEHFSHRETVSLLGHWRSYLQVGGLLHLEVPNLTGHVDAWRAGQSDDSQFVTYLYGDQDHEFNYHKTAFTEHSLHAALEAAGYFDVSVKDIGLVLVAQARAL